MKKTIELKPCPFCGGTDLIFSANHQHGHGDMGYTDARYVCKSCIATDGQSDYGMTNNSVKARAANAWNTRGSVAAEPVFIKTEEESREESHYRLLAEKYSNMNVFEFLESLLQRLERNG